MESHSEIGPRPGLTLTSCFDLPFDCFVPCRLTRRCTAVRLLGSRAGIPKGAWMFVSCVCCVKIKIYRTVILPVFLRGRESWSRILREECSLRVFENRVLRRIFGP